MQRKFSIFEERDSFTLAEIVAVVVILALLAGIVTPQIVKTIQKGRDSRRIADIDYIARALQTYYMENGSYPSVSDNDSGGWDYSNDGTFIPQLSAGGYVTQDIEDPKNDSSYYYAYKKFSAGANSAPSARGAYAVIACKKFEVLSAIAGAGNTIAPGYNWNANFDYYIMLFER